MISIFNGRERRLGKTSDRIFAQFDVAFRRYIHLFKNARLHVFLEIALHSDEWGFSWPSAATICRHTGYGEDTVWYAIRDLEALSLDGARVLQRYPARAPGNRVANNVYLVFPTDEEIERYRDAVFSLVDDRDRGRTLRIALPDSTSSPPDFPYSENPRSAIPPLEKPATADPESEPPAPALPGSARPSRKNTPLQPNPDQSRSRTAKPNESETTTIALPARDEPTPSGTVVGTTGSTADVPAAVQQVFADANGRPANPIERRGLGRIARRWQAARAVTPAEAWAAIEAAIVEAVESGSAFVAVRRIEAICDRWLGDGVEYVAVPEASVRRTAQSEGAPVRTDEDRLGGLWRRIVEHVRPKVARSAQQGWLGEITLVERRGALLIAEVSDEATADWVAGRYGPLLEKAAAAVVGEAVQLEVRAARRTDVEALGQA